MALFDSILTIKGFARKFKISEDVPKTAWATVTDIETIGETAAAQIAEAQAMITAALSNIQHDSLIGISPNQHHNKYHGDSHDGKGSDPLILPFEFTKDGTVYAKIDENGNLFIKGRILKL